MLKIKKDYAEVNDALLYYEMAGSGPAFIMIHAGIADCRMWDNEFKTSAHSHLVMRYDMRATVAAFRSKVSSIFRMI